jgi:hypothetical protein
MAILPTPSDTAKAMVDIGVEDQQAYRLVNRGLNRTLLNPLARSSGSARMEKSYGDKFENTQADYMYGHMT